MKKTSRFLLRMLVTASMFSPVSLMAAQNQQVSDPIVVPVNSKPSVYLEEIGVGSGYAWSHMKRSHASFSAIPAYVRLGFNMNSLVGMQGSSSTLQLGLEPFVNTITEPKTGIETGLDVFIRYLHPITSSAKLVAEVGSGPMYLSIDTREQGDAGFNFMNQFGLGTQFRLGDDSALTVGYRFRHVSNAGTSQPNSGINSNAIVISYSFFR